MDLLAIIFLNRSVLLVWSSANSLFIVPLSHLYVLSTRKRKSTVDYFIFPLFSVSSPVKSEDQHYLFQKGYNATIIFLFQRFSVDFRFCYIGRWPLSLVCSVLFSSHLFTACPAAVVVVVVVVVVVAVAGAVTAACVSVASVSGKATHHTRNEHFWAGPEKSKSSPSFSGLFGSEKITVQKQLLIEEKSPIRGIRGIDPD